MKKAKTSSTPNSTPNKRRPAISPEARENQLAAYAFDLVEQRLLDGTASSQETTHFLKLVSSKARLERERAELENELIKAKTKALQSQERMEELYANAIKAMSQYNGRGDVGDDGDLDAF